LPDEEYRFISVCERGKPIRTNNPSTFAMHVASCPTCLNKLPDLVIEELQPRLVQIIDERKQKGLSAEAKKPSKKEVPTKEEPESATRLPSSEGQAKAE